MGKRGWAAGDCADFLSLLPTRRYPSSFGLGTRLDVPPPVGEAAIVALLSKQRAQECRDKRSPVVTTLVCFFVCDHRKKRRRAATERKPNDRPQQRSGHTNPLRSGHANRVRSTSGQIKRNAARKRAAVINCHRNGSSILRIGNRHLRPERKRAMRGGQAT